MAEYLTQTEIDYIAWKADNPMMLFGIIVLVGIILWCCYLLDRDRKIYASRVARERKIARRRIREEGGL